MSQTRQLAAVMFSDIQGFSALMQSDEEKAVQVKDRYRTVLESLHNAFKGRLVHYYGDGALSIFSSVVDAVNCAKEMQLQFNTGELYIPVRIGLHLGDIIVSQDDVFGDGVNVASRIESLGVPGSVLISAKVKEELANHPDLQSVTVGNYQFKNFDREIEVFALNYRGLTVPSAGSLDGKIVHKSIADTPDKKHYKLIIARLFLILTFFAVALVVYFLINANVKQKAPVNVRRLAVLPIRNLSGDASDEYLSDGISDELITKLSTLTDLKVISRNSTQQYKLTPKKSSEIGNELHVTNLIEGTIKKEGDKLSINIQLIDARSDEIIWSEQFVKNAEELLNFYNQIASGVAQQLNLTLQEKVQQKLLSSKKINPEQYKLYLKGLFSINKFTIKDFFEAIDFFDQALKIDSSYAEALAGKALCNTMLGVFNPAIGTKEALTKTLTLVHRALAIDSNQILAHRAEGYAKMFFNRDLTGAEVALKKAEILDPSSDATLTGLVLINLYKGNTDSAAYWVQKFEAIAPLSFWLKHQQGRVLYLQHRVDEAFDSYLNAIPVFNHIILYDHLSNLYNQSGKYQESIVLLNTAITKFNDIPGSTFAWLAEAYYKTGNKSKARQILVDLEDKVNAQKLNVAFYVAAYYSSIHELDKAFYYMNKSIELNDVDLLWLHQEPHLAFMRKDPRWSDIERKVKFY
jgi:TolB-like protein/class 3 adenylate cyclase/Tfp pilus assembly protein PilF